MPRQTYTKNEVTSWPIPNYWDAVALCFVVALLVLLGWGAKEMLVQFNVGQQTSISLNPAYLPYYALRSVLRMLIALGFSLIFTFIFGSWAAKSRSAEKLIIPLIDILQSVPVLGFLTITVPAFILLFRGSMLGPEAAAIFAIFTAQVWNMALSLYQSIKTVPSELTEAGLMFRLSPWQKFWRIDTPFAMPGLIWNMMMSMSCSWVFLVASEAISVAGHHINLPGVGSYIALAILQKDKMAILYSIITMLLVILIYDQILFRPLVAWSQKFRASIDEDDDEPESWILNLFQRTAFFNFIGASVGWAADRFVNLSILRNAPARRYYEPNETWRRIFAILWSSALALGLIASVLILFLFIKHSVPFSEIVHTFYLGAVTALRVLIIILISSIIWVPIGVWVGSKAKVAQVVQPIAQFLAAFPANLLFPIVFMLIVKYHLSVNIWVSPLMVLGTQWYILFNVIAGASSLPKNLRQAVGTLNVTGWLWWRKFMLPAIFPYYITGAITAAGGAWNISIIAEAVQWGNQQLDATGLGAYITQVATKGSFEQLVLGISVMSLYVLAFNHFLWKPLYNLAEERFQIL